MAAGEQVLNKLLERVAREQGYDDFQIISKQISSDGANFTCYMYQASITAPSKTELKLFIKVSAAGEKLREFAPFPVFKTEIFAYSKLLKTYKDLEEKHNIPETHRLVTPKFYGSSVVYLQEALVLEDLSASGYTAYDRFKPINWEYTVKCIQNLVKLHALSIAWSIEDPEGFKNTNIHTADNVVNSLEYLKMLVPDALRVIRKENKERVSKFIDRILETNNYLSLNRPITRAVFSHGDYRTSNLMHKIKEDGSIEVISLDYQTFRRSSPLVDLMFFIFSGSDKSFRDHHFKQTLELYYEELSAALRRLHLDSEQIYPRRDYDIEVQKVLPFGLITGMFGLMFVTSEVQAAPKFTKDTVITDILIKPSDLYKTRLNEIVDDLIEMGVL